METVYLPLQRAPSKLNQSILQGWSFNLFNVNELTEAEKDTLRVFLVDVSAIRKIKADADAAR